MESFLEVLDALVSWPTVVLVVILVFSKQLKALLGILSNRNASLKLPGIEVSLKELQGHAPSSSVLDDDSRLAAAISKAVAKLPDRSPEAVQAELNRMLADHRRADLHLYLETVSYQLVAWLNSHRSGEPFGIGDLLTEEHIPIEHDGMRAGAYCIHSTHEQEAVAAEFRRNYWNLIRYGVVKPVDDTQVRIAEDSLVQGALDKAMEEIVRTENERAAISRFIDKFFEGPEDEAPELASGVRQADALQKPKKS